ncbi:MAG: cytochrome c oxidase subunit I [Anaerolineales bacterium]|nr:cytochrome c oxidase subunit I [Anaerolineales bacterium]
MRFTSLVPDITTPLPELRSDEGLLSWLATVDHKKVGLLYILVSMFFLLIGGVEALLIRVQLARPENHFLSPELYNQFFTMHGTTMIFLVVMPMLIGFGNYLIPLMIGARDMAFPRLNALGIWTLVFGGLMIYFSFISGPAARAPDAGWFSYAPLTEEPFTSWSNPGVNYWALGLLVTGVGTVAAGINFLVTILNLRAPGMTMRRLPLLVWMFFVNSFLIIIALSLLNGALVLLTIDRLLGAFFFRPEFAGSAVLWQHYFWAFGHPEVYIMALPAFAIISEVIPVFSRKPIFGYSFVAGSTAAIGLLSMGVWAHHMFAVGLGFPADTFFLATSALIAIPTGVKIFNWVATMWGGAIRFTTAMLFAIAFLILFTIGGITGVMFAAVPIDWQLTDSYFVVAHFHYVLFGGTFFAIMAGVFYWFPKVSGRMLSERLGKLYFWLLFIGFNLTFFIQHFLGLMGMPRRVYTYPDLAGWGAMNLISSIGALLMAVAILVLLVTLVHGLLRGEPAGDNPWDAWTLEWATTSPPPVHNFDRLPPIRSRRPLWDVAHPDQADWRHPEARGGPDPTGEPHLVEKNKLGVGFFLLSESNFFLILILTYVILHAASTFGPTAADSLKPLVAGINTLFLIASSFTVWQAERALKHSVAGMRLWLAATILLGVIFLVGQGIEWYGLINDGIVISSNLFTASFFTATGFHGFHVVAGLIALSIVLGLAFARDYKPGHSRALAAISLYWHFVDVVWVVLFAVIYLGIYV